jgi:PKD domain
LLSNPVREILFYIFGFLIGKMKKNDSPFFCLLCLVVISALFQNCKKKEEEAPRPSIDFTVSNHIGVAPISANFTAITESGNSIDWDFGDGATGTGISTTHTYTTQGVFYVSAKAKNNNGESYKYSYVNISPYTKLYITSVYTSVKNTKPSGGTWDISTGTTNPDIYFKLFNSGGVESTISPYPYINNTLVGTLGSSAPAITDFANTFNIKIYDYDFGASADELITSQSFRPFDYFGSSLPFPNNFSKTDSYGNLIKANVTWAQ